MSITELGAKVREQKIVQSLDSAIVQTTYNDNSVEVVVRYYKFGSYRGDNAMDGVFNAMTRTARLLDNGGASAYPYADDEIHYSRNGGLWTASIYRVFTDIASK